MSGTIGVFDSGVGGLTVVRAILQLLPDESIVYFGDTARVPYGTKSRETIIKFALEDAQFLVSKGVKVIVVACNSVSSNALVHLEERFEVPIIGVIETVAKAACEVTRNGKVGVIGTKATVESGAYDIALNRHRAGLDVRSVPCPLFVPLAEEGWLDGEVTRLVAGKYLAPLLDWGMDTLLLGCTHYPLLRSAIAEVTGPEVILIDSAEATARELAQLLKTGDLAASGGAEAQHHFYLSDLPRNFSEIGKRFLGRTIDLVHRVDLASA
jgi:glutamate racemase